MAQLRQETTSFQARRVYRPARIRNYSARPRCRQSTSSEEVLRRCRETNAHKDRGQQQRKRTMEAYDIITVGSGHNALVAAALLARAGNRVLVGEQNDEPGRFG